VAVGLGREWVGRAAPVAAVAGLREQALARAAGIGAGRIRADGQAVAVAGGVVTAYIKGSSSLQANTLEEVLSTK
jgi:hypothetical protein